MNTRPLAICIIGTTIRRDRTEVLKWNPPEKHEAEAPCLGWCVDFKVFISNTLMFASQDTACHPSQDTIRWSIASEPDFLWCMYSKQRIGNNRNAASFKISNAFICLSPYSYACALTVGLHTCGHLKMPSSSRYMYHFPLELSLHYNSKLRASRQDRLFTSQSNHNNLIGYKSMWEWTL